MRVRFASLLLTPAVLLTAGLAGCSGEHAATALPRVTQPSQPSANRGQTKVHVGLTIHIPKRRRGKRPAYVGAGTQSMTLTISKGKDTLLSKTVNLTPSNTQDCGPALEGTTCTVSVLLAPGTGYAASITTYDRTNARGHVLSLAQSIAFSVKAGTNNVLGFTLNAVPAKIVTEMAGTNSFYVQATDADGNILLGAGAPNFTAASTGGPTLVHITQPTRTNPNTISVTEVSPTPAAAPIHETIGVTASFRSGTNPCSQTGAVCTLADAATASSVAVSTAFLPDNSATDTLGFTVPMTASNEAAKYAIASDPSGIAMDAGGNVFESSGGDLIEISPPYSGVTQDVSGGGTGGGVALDAAGDVWSAGNSFAAEIQPPYTSVANSFSRTYAAFAAVAVDASANLYVSNSSGGFSIYAPGSYSSAAYSVAPALGATSLFVFGNKLYVGGSEGVTIYALPITSDTPTPIATLTSPYNAVNMTLDASGDLFVACYAGQFGGDIVEFPAPISSGASPAVTIPISADPVTVATDSNGYLYVNVIGTGGGLYQYEPPFSSRSVPTSTTSNGITESVSFPAFGILNALVLAPAAPRFSVSAP